MKSRIYKVIFAALAVSLVGIYSCADLDVENLNAPDSKRAIESADDLEGVAGGAYRTILNASMNYGGPALPLMTMADRTSCSWGNAAMRDLSSEPRIAFNNTIPYSYSYVNLDYWQDMNGALSQVNDVLIQIDQGAVIKDAATTAMVKAWCYFIQGVAHGHIANVMQKGFIVDETTDLSALEWKTYKEMLDAAVGYLDRAAAACQATTFETPTGWFRGYTYDNVELAKLCNFYAAKFMIGNARNATEDAATDWNKIKTYCQNGLDYDFIIDFDGYTSWYGQLLAFTQLEGWLRVDMRVVHMMDPNYPSRWRDDGKAPDHADYGDMYHPASSDDARLESDFRVLETVPFRPERGYYHFSYYGYWRYPAIQIETQAVTGSYPVYPKTENDYMLAEALLRTGDKAGAIAILNASPRVTRGNLDPLAGTASDTDVQDAIMYERTIELFSHSLGTGFFDMRRTNQLQPGTLLHFPIPGKELETLGEPYYSLGGTFGEAGIDYADSDWGWPGYDVAKPY